MQAGLDAGVAKLIIVVGFLSRGVCKVTAGICGSDSVSAFCPVRDALLTKRKNFFAHGGSLGELKETVKCQALITRDGVVLSCVPHGSAEQVGKGALADTILSVPFLPCPCGALKHAVRDP